MSTTAQFAFVCCAHGAEVNVKKEVARDGWRLAFSRPGFVTLKREPTRKQKANELPQGIFVRTASHSLGQVLGNTESGFARSVELLDGLIAKLEKSPAAGQPFDQLHVWPKDRAAIGRFDFEPGIDEVSRAVAGEIHAKTQGHFVNCAAANRVAEPGQRVLDIVLVEPSHWFVGHHEATIWPTRWPGAVQPIKLAEPPISRAYFKAAESIQWSGFNLRPDDLAIEIGSAPGGACQRLLEMGLRVIGIDPAEMDETIAEHPRFQHIRARAGDIPRREYRGAKWLLVDSTVAPAQTLQTVQNIVTNQHSDLVGLLITLKLGDYAGADAVDEWYDRIAAWGTSRIQVRQLARNRCEVCFAVTLKSQKP